jgi:signal transduction histidine kinase
LNEKKEELEQTLSQLQATQQQLVMQEKMVSLGNLVAGVAHEINTPVAAVSSSAETSRLSIQKILEYLENRKEAGTVSFQRAIDILRKSQDVTSKASQRIATIVRSLRHFARLDESERERADLEEGLETTLALLQHELKDRIQVVKSYGELPRVDCHPDQMNQVFMNLLLNAARAIEGRGTIAITTAAEGDQVSIAISDTGVGIPQEHRQRIFDPGFTTKGVGVGTGLGLATSYRIVKDHGGEIEVESISGKGTTFTVQLPVDATAGNGA